MGLGLCLSNIVFQLSKSYGGSGKDHLYLTLFCFIRTPCDTIIQCYQAFNFAERNVCTAALALWRPTFKPAPLSSSSTTEQLNETIGRGVMDVLLYNLNGWITLTSLNFQLDSSEMLLLLAKG